MEQRSGEKAQESAPTRRRRLYPGQQTLTPDQEAKARRFAAEYRDTQLSTKPVDESAVEALLMQAYTVAQLPPPIRIHWVDGPLQLLYLLTLRTPHHADERVRESMWKSVRESIERSVDRSTWESVRVQEGVYDDVGGIVYEGVWDRVRDSLWETVHASMLQSVEELMSESIGQGVWDSVGHNIHGSVSEIVWNPAWERVGDSEWREISINVGRSVWETVMAYKSASTLAYYRFFDVHLSPNALHPLAEFNQLVSGYRLGSEAAIIVRRPCMLAHDAAGQLHSATGKCLEYRDGWGLYAWHGVRVPEKVVLAPERLKREDFLSAPNVEVRRVIQERMSDRFVLELGGVELDTGSRGILYEVVLPEDDPERVAQYVQVRDSSTSRMYFLRVPPTIQSADEAVAWSFQLGIAEYKPICET